MQKSLADPFASVIDKRKQVKTEKNLSLVTLILLDMFLLVNTSLTLPNLIFYSESIVIIIIFLIGYLFVKSGFKKKPSTRLASLIFIIIFLNTMSLHRFISNLSFASILSISLIGIIISSLKMSKEKIRKQKKLVSREAEIDKELDDDWKSEPRLIYD